MDVLTAVGWTVGGLVVMGLLLFGLAAFVIVALVVYRMLSKKAAAVGIDLSDGIDERELKIITDLFARQKAIAAEQAVAVDMVNAAQASLKKSPAV